MVGQLKNKVLIPTALCAILFSYFYLDRQLVWFLVDHKSRSFPLLKIFANDISLIIMGLIFIFYSIFALRFQELKENKLVGKLIILCNTIVITIFIKDILKVIFGRYWADTFICNNPSLIQNHVYGFNWFNGGHTFLSFPSGHTAMIVAFATSLSLLFPVLRWYGVFLAILVASSQILLYFHYLSDAIAGALLGYLVAQYTYRYSLK